VKKKVEGKGKKTRISNPRGKGGGDSRLGRSLKKGGRSVPFFLERGKKKKKKKVSLLSMTINKGEVPGGKRGGGGLPMLHENGGMAVLPSLRDGKNWTRTKKREKGKTIPFFLALGGEGGEGGKKTVVRAKIQE